MQSMEPATQHFLDEYFRSFNAGDEAAHRDLWGPDLTYFSSTLRTGVQGLATLQGVWSAIRDGVGIRTITPLQILGQAPELAVRVRFQGAGGHPSVEAMMVFHFTADHRIARLGVHWDPGTFLRAREQPGLALPARESLEDKDPRVQAALDPYFRTFHASDEAGHMALFHPDMTFFGSLSGVESSGRASAMGIFRSAQSTLGIRRLTPKRIFGDWPELSVLLDMATQDGSTRAEAVYVFQLDEGGIIRRLATLWNPLPYLKELESP